MRQIVLNALLLKKHRTLKEDMFICAMPHYMTLKHCPALSRNQIIKRVRFRGT